MCVSFVGERNKKKESIERKLELTYIKQLACEYQSEGKSTDRGGRSAHFPATQRRLLHAGEQEKAEVLHSSWPLDCCVSPAPFFSRLFLWAEETRLLLCLPHPVGLHQQVKDELVLFHALCFL